MPPEPTIQDLTEEIRDLFDTKIGHFADKSARWLFRHKGNVQGLTGRTIGGNHERITFTTSSVELAKQLGVTIRWCYVILKPSGCGGKNEQ